ncbi:MULTISPECIES: M13 family metallopeptidase [unclassified Lactobacillus]|uniref:M13 family metallopeptidase n=1 Tax=unclassified Lactobacillus TaxID=2620435 RepID=UPI000EFA638E|nr:MULTISPECIES: M13 family metallopeptidase [unclassified Lactobacillus]RMC23550.1 M13 family peptidase [Lactobacillus sp. ESL0247]RMC27349.1 M13 family peptidase [Lactobacillus sp. ESL0246]RMC30475.1 M13 family peptidase [Lactobacillus sp. ESL0245]
MKKISTIRGGSGDVIEPKVGTRPQDNIYLAVNSDWLEKTKIPSDRSRMASFDGIDVNVEKHLMQDFADFASGKKEVPNVPNLKKAVKLYQLASDFDKRNREGAEPIKSDLTLLAELKDFSDFNLKAPDLTTFASMPFGFDVEPDMKNTKVNVLNFAGPGTFLPDTTTYQTEDAAKLLTILQQQSVKLLEMAGIDSAVAEKYAADAIKFDAKLAKVVKSSEEWADYPATYNPMKIADFEAKFSEFKIDYYLKEVIGEEPARIIVAEPRYLDHINELVNKDNFEEIKGWMIVNFINDVASELSQSFREAAFPFSQALSGQPQLSDGIKQAYHIANGSFSEVVGVYYGQTYFGSEAKKDVEDMIRRMLAVYKERLAKNSWLSEATKKKAIVKLEALELKIGYPDKIEEIYNRLEVIPANQGGSLYSNERAFAIEEQKYNIEQLHREVDRTIWAMPGNLVNACYDPQRNDLTFPAAILQAPFYDLKQDRATNFGGIGTVIAHEVSHAFDNNGAQFDELGNMTNWWTDEDYAEFKKRTQAEIDLFDGLEYGPVKLNGKQIVSENIADQGGLTAAVEAAKNENDDLKKLFENFARIWANKQLTESIKTQTAVDVHAPGPLRANVQTQCQDDFYEAFDVKPEDGMWLEPDKRVHIW